MIRAVVFDFDGLIQDTETYEYYSFVNLLGEYGVELPLELYSSRIGGDTDTFCPYSYLESSIGRTLERERLRERRREIYAELIHTEKTRPGVEDYLQAAQRMGLRIGLASSAPSSWVMPNLEELGLVPYFECIRTHDDAVRVKPDPELYLNVLDALGVNPRQAVAFEDSPNGALAAFRANMRCVIVPNKLTEQLTFGHYDLRLSSMKDMGLEEVLARLG